MKQDIEYDVAIVGGGLAGLALSIQLAKQGYKIVVFEKERYPFHKVCGEYISLECRDFLHVLGIDTGKMNLPFIQNLQVSAPNGKILKHKLPLGGFGVSRYLLDQQLATIAVREGAMLMENCKVEDVLFAGDCFRVQTTMEPFKARVVCGSFGKKSNLDIKWKRAFAIADKNKLNNYIGVKYHIKTNFPIDTIALHNFDNGYCGIVSVEDARYNLCYLTTASNLRRCGNNIQQMEKEILCKNPHLDKIFSESKFLFPAPLVISQISFDQKSQVEQHMLMIGDAAGMITPLCGNGMSMALHGSKLAAEQVHHFLKGNINRAHMESSYSAAWKSHFSGRLKMGRRFQRIFANPRLMSQVIGIARAFPVIVDPLIRKTHGQPF